MVELIILICVIIISVGYCFGYYIGKRTRPPGSYKPEVEGYTIKYVSKVPIRSPISPQEQRNQKTINIYLGELDG